MLQVVEQWFYGSLLVAIPFTPWVPEAATATIRGTDTQERKAVALVGSHSLKRCHGCERVSVPQMVATGLAVMSVAPIGATALPCRFWNPQRERNRSQRGTPTAKNGTPLPWLPLMDVAPINGTALPWLLPFPNVVTVAKVVALAVLVLKSSEGTESEPTGNHNGKAVAVRLMVNVVALPWLSLIVVAPINGTALPCWYRNPRSEWNLNRKGLQNHCTTTCSMAKDPPTLLQDHNRQNGCRLALLCVRSSEGLSLIPERCRCCESRCPCRFWNPRRERNRSQRGTKRQDGCPYRFRVLVAP